jgi:uncharacterized protein (DUF58 family)
MSPRYASIQRFAERWLGRGASGARRAVWLSRRITLSREGAYYLFMVVAIFIGAAVRDSNLMLLLGGMLAGPLVLSVWFALRGLRGIELGRELPERICAGERLVVEVSCTNRRRRLASWALVVEDALYYAGPLVVRRPTPARVLFPYVPPRETSRAVYEGLPPVRGRYRFGPLRVVTRFPLGLVRYERTFDDVANLIVWPRFGRITPGGLGLDERSELGLQRTERRQARRQADFYGLRDWRSGDSRRWIHWRSTARRGQIVVRQFDESRSQDLAVFVDLWQPPGENLAAREHVETAVSLAATVLADMCRRGGRRLALDLMAAEPFRLDGWASQSLLRGMLDALSLAQSHRAADLPAEFRERLFDVRPPWTALVISTRTVDLAAATLSARRPVSAAAASTIKSINVGSPELARIFELGA